MITPLLPIQPGLADLLEGEARLRGTNPERRSQLLQGSIADAEFRETLRTEAREGQQADEVAASAAAAAAAAAATGGNGGSVPPGD